MSKTMQGRAQKSGLPPGTLVHIGEKKRETAEITVFDYNEHKLEEKTLESVDRLGPLKDWQGVRWINVDGIHQPEVLEKLGERFGLHPLVLEDVLNANQRPKMEDYGDYIYVVAKMVSYNERNEGMLIEQVSLILGREFVISFQEEGGDVFDPIRTRLRSGMGRIRKAGADYLLYSLLDAIVDNYFVVLEKFGDKIEYVEDEMVVRPKPRTLHLVHYLKRQMLFLHKSIWPLREVAGALERGESSLIQDSTQVYLRDVYDHIVQSMDTTETFRDMLSGMLDIYLSSVSNRMNEVMKVLAIISTLFMPLTFLAGLYGMNFRHMPELEWSWGYPAVLLLMAVTTVIMIIFFKKKKWF